MAGQETPIPILYQDQRVLVCLKPPGVVSVDQPGGLPDLLRAQLGGEGACLRTVHRLDQRVGGVMVLARSRKAAQLLSGQVADRTFHKGYLAVLSGIPAQEAGTLEDLLGYDRSARRAYVAQEPGREVRRAALRGYRPGMGVGVRGAGDRAHPPDPGAVRLTGHASGRGPEVRRPGAGGGGHRALVPCAGVRPPPDRGADDLFRPSPG